MNLPRRNQRSRTTYQHHETAKMILGDDARRIEGVTTLCAKDNRWLALFVTKDRGGMRQKRGTRILGPRRSLSRSALYQWFSSGRARCRRTGEGTRRCRWAPSARGSRRGTRSAFRPLVAAVAASAAVALEVAATRRATDPKATRTGPPRPVHRNIWLRSASPMPPTTADSTVADALGGKTDTTLTEATDHKNKADTSPGGTME